MFSYKNPMNIWFTDLKKRKSPAMNIFQYINVAAVYIVTPLMLYPQYLFVLSLSYLVIGAAWAFGQPVDEDDVQLEEQTSTG